MTGTDGCAFAQIYGEQLHLANYDRELRDTVYLRTET